MGRAEECCDPGCERCGGAGSHGLNVRGVAEVEATEALGLAGGQTVRGGRQAGAAGPTHPSADGGVGALGSAAAGCSEGVEGGTVVAVVGEGGWAGGAGGAGSGIFRTGRIGGGDDGEDATGLGWELDETRVGEVVGVVAGCGDDDDTGLGGGVGDAVEGGLETGTVAGGEVYDDAEGHGDDVGTVGDGIVDSLDDPTEETTGLSCGTFGGEGGFSCNGDWHALEDLDVEEGGGWGDADDLSSIGPLCGCGERGGPGAVAGLILRGAVVAWAGQAGLGGLVDLREIEGEVGCEIGVGGVDSAIENSDADAVAHGGVPRASGWAAGDVVAVASDLADCPALRAGVEGVEGELRAGWSDDDAEGGLRNWAQDEVAGGDDTVVQDVLDVGQGGEAAEGGGVGSWSGGAEMWLDHLGVDLDGDDTEAVVTQEDGCTGGMGVGGGVRGDDGIAIDEDISMRNDGCGLGLRMQEWRGERDEEEETRR